MLFYVYIAIASFVTSLIGTKLTIATLRKRKAMIDRPNPRGNHKVPTPRGGGIALVLTFAIFLLMSDASYGIVLALFMLAAVSLLDDLSPLPPWIRLLVQAGAVFFALPAVDVPAIFGGLVNPLWANIIIALVWLWFINLFNFMDGIDGISACEMISVGFGIFIICVIGKFFPSDEAAFALIIGASGCGFIWWNWHPAKIFLGDVGSVPIGFLLCFLLLQMAAAGFWVVALILPAYYLADGTITIIRRAAQGKKIWKPHSEHFYQKAVRSGRSHDTVVRHIFGINMLLIFLAVFTILNPELAWLNLLTAYVIVFLLLWAYARMYRRHQHDEQN